MAKAQLPIDGKLGKDFKVTSPMGNRIHPVTKEKKHHNGSDIWSPHEPCWIEAPYDGKVLESKKSTAPGGGFGNYVKLLHNINGKWYTTLYAHMADGLKVKVGQKIEAGTILGKMASTGMSTGKHLHWELKEGKDHAWNNTGKGYIEPIQFFQALVALEAVTATASVETKADDPVLPAPVHGPTQKTPVGKPPLSGLLKIGSTGACVKYMQTVLKIEADGKFGPITDKAVREFQAKNKLKVDGIVGPITYGKM
jgi:murein DD-endopeptidase MepM/ murein hydrolase activator NlpD